MKNIIDNGEGHPTSLVDDDPLKNLQPRASKFTDRSINKDTDSSDLIDFENEEADKFLSPQNLDNIVYNEYQNASQFIPR